MSFEEIWHEHKSFILILLAGVVVFFTARYIITSSFEDDIKRNKAAAARSLRSASRSKVPTGAKGLAEEKLRLLEEELAKLQTEMSYRPTAGYTLKGAARAGDLHFNDMVQKLLTEVVEPASSLDIRIDTGLGLDGRTPRSDPEREWYLNGLDVVHRICLAGIGGGVESIEPIKIARFPKKRSKRGEASPFVRELKVNFTVHGRPAALEELTRRLMTPGARLAIKKSSLLSLDSDKKTVIRFGGDDIVRMDMEVVALLVDDEGLPKNSRSASRS